MVQLNSCQSDLKNKNDKYLEKHIFFRQVAFLSLSWM